MIRAAFLLSLLIGLPGVARAQAVDACKLFGADLAQAVAGKPMTQTRASGPGLPTSMCEYKDQTGTAIVGVAVWRLASPEKASTSMQTMMKEIADAVGGKLEPVPGVGDEAMFLGQTSSIYVRKGAVWAVFGHPNRKAQLIDAARKLLSRM